MLSTLVVLLTACINNFATVYQDNDPGGVRFTEHSSFGMKRGIRTAVTKKAE